APGLRPGVLGSTFGFPLGKRCGASLVSSQRLFELLSQALVLRQCALQLLLQGLDAPFEFLLPIRGATAIGRLHPFHDDTNAEICSELSLKVLYLLSYPLVNILLPIRHCRLSNWRFCPLRSPGTVRPPRQPTWHSPPQCVGDIHEETPSS